MIAITLEELKSFCGISGSDDSRDSALDVILNIMLPAISELVYEQYHESEAVRLGALYLVAEEVVRQGSNVKRVKAGRMEIEYAMPLPTTTLRNKGLELLGPYMIRERARVLENGADLPFVQTLATREGVTVRDGNMRGWDR